MNAYQEIRLKPGIDVGLYFLWHKVFQKVHIALVENKIAEKQSAIGLAFPEYNAAKFALGNKLRLFAPSESLLQAMNIEKYLASMADYLQFEPIKAIPNEINGYCVFKQVKTKESKGALVRRRMKRKQETEAQALQYFSNYEPTISKLPYIKVHSITTGQRFPLFVGMQELGVEKEGLFSCYGLSKESTVPMF